MAATSNADKLAQLQQAFDSAGRQPGVPYMQTSELWTAIQEGHANLVIVDVRSAPEQEVSVLPGPVVTQADLETDEKQVLHEGSMICCYCTIGVRSGKYAAQLRQQGYNAMNLQGGILGWAHAGYPLVELKDRQRTTQRVHVYGPRWALQPDGYEAVMFKPKNWLTGWLPTGWFTRRS